MSWLLLSGAAGASWAKMPESKPAETKTAQNRSNNSSAAKSVRTGQTNSNQSAPTAVKTQQREMAATVSRPAKKKVWVLEQETSQLGRMTIYAGQDALLVKVGSTGGFVVSKAPDWKVTFYNTIERMVYQVSYDQFQKQEIPSLIATTDYFEGRKLKPRPINYRGVPALLVSAPTPQGSVGMMMPSWSGVGNTKTPKTVEVNVIATATQNQVPKEILAILKAIYRIPRFGGFPIGVVFKHSDGSNGVTLATYNIQQKEVPASLFNQSTRGFAPTKTAETAILHGMLDSAFSETP